MTEETHFYSLTPDKVLDAIEEIGVRCTGRSLALNSMENRVYEVEIEVDEQDVQKRSDRYRVAKFYRPGRWTKEQILDEHKFLLELDQKEIPVVAPLLFPDGSTLKQFEDTNIFFTVFPKVQGRNLDELHSEQLTRIGRLIGRIHQIGSIKPAEHRLSLTPEYYCDKSIEFLKGCDYIPSVMRESLFQVMESLSSLFEDLFKGVHHQRIHGDCHVGNILWIDDFCNAVDFDDFLNGPPVQDLWLLTPGRDEDSLKARETLIKGYEEFMSFNPETLRLVEPLRTLRIIYFSSWIGRRYEDPSFQRTFPHYRSEQYWRDNIITLQEQLQIIQYGEAFQ